MTAHEASLELVGNHIWKTLPSDLLDRLKTKDILGLSIAVAPYLDIQDAILNGPLGKPNDP